MGRYLFPRLNDVVVDRIWSTIHDKQVKNLEKHWSTEHPEARYAATGGTKVDREHLEFIRKSLLAIAEKNGFPENSTRESRSNFDTEAAVWLYESGKIPLGEALRKESWSFLASVLMPDICLWRFPDLKLERLKGGIRNTFRRLWFRAFLLGDNNSDEDRWVVIKELTEDAFVSITERPGLSSNPTVARAIGLEWIKTSKVVGKNRMENIHRDAMKRLRALAPLLNLDVVSTEQLEKNIREIFKIVSVPENVEFMCKKCHGTGLIGEKRCSVCSGKGFFKSAGMDDNNVICPDCRGSGLVKASECQHCSGFGIIQI